MSHGIRLSCQRERCVTKVSNVFIDHYMTNANGEFVKIYLYLLRCIAADMDNLSISSIADHFNNTEKDVKRALEYWEKMHLLRLEYDSENILSSIEVLELEEELEAANVKNDSVKLKSYKSNKAKELTDLSPEEQAKFKDLMYAVSVYLGKTLSPEEMNKIVFFNEKLGFSLKLIEYLVEYCVSCGYDHLSSIEKIALEWHKNKVTTITEAQEQIANHTKINYSVMKAFGITGRNLTSSEKDFIKRWTKEYCFSDEIILLACDRTIEFTHQPSFKYADTILSKWNKENVTSLADINAIDLSHKENEAKVKRAQFKQVQPADNKFNNFKQRSYDYEDLEKQLLAAAKVQ